MVPFKLVIFEACVFVKLKKIIFSPSLLHFPPSFVVDVTWPPLERFF